MNLQDSGCLISGSRGPLGLGLATHLAALGARILAGEDGAPEYFFHVIEPEDAPLQAHDEHCCEREVLAPVLRAARLAPRLRYICLIDAADPDSATPDGVHAQTLERALGGLAQRLGLPFSVLRGRAGAPKAGGMAAMAAYAARARLNGVLDLSRGDA